MPLKSVKSDEILQEIHENLNDNDIKLEKLGQPLPQDNNSKSAYVHHLLSRFCRKFTSVLEDRGNNINTGRNLKDCFIHFLFTVHIIIFKKKGF